MAGVHLTTSENEDNLEMYSLVWLDASVNSSPENIQVQRQLKLIIHHMIPFEDEHTCLHYIRDLSEEDRIILIASGRFGRSIVPKITNQGQVTSIFIYCMDKQANEIWSRPFKKVKGVFTRLDELIKRIERDFKQQQLEKTHETIPFTIFNDKESSENFNGQFIFFQLLIDCLIRLKPSSSKNELVTFCKEYYKNNNAQLVTIREFESTYASNKALWWYTKHSCIARLLDRALLNQNIDLLYLFQFLIYDLGCELGQNMSLSPKNVYRRTAISNEKLQILKTSVGKFVSINSFLTASSDAKRLRSLHDSIEPSDNVANVLFDIQIDPRSTNIRPFNSIQQTSPDERIYDVIFMVGSIFRCGKAVQDSDRHWTIFLVLCDISDQELTPLSNQLKKHLGTGQTNLLQFGDIINRMDKFKNVEKYYRRYLNQLPNGHSDIGYCYHTLGMTADLRGDYGSSLRWYNKSLDALYQSSEPDRLKLAEIHFGIATVCLRLSDAKNAMNAYKKAIDLWKECHQIDHPRLAQCFNNMGSIYEMNKEYTEALHCYDEVLKILQTKLPAYHQDVAEVHRNIGHIHEMSGDYKQAISAYDKSLKIYKHSLPETKVNVEELEKLKKQLSSKIK